jgi:hypothetical protein
MLVSLVSVITIIISPLVSHANKILILCEDFAAKWKLVFNINKCNWYVHGNGYINNPKFILNQSTINKGEIREKYDEYLLHKDIKP